MNLSFEDSHQIGMLSRLTKTKDHNTILLALYNLLKKGYKIKFMIAGDGETKKEIEKKAKELNLENAVIFCGMLKEDEVLNFFKSIDIYVHSTLGETLSTALLQSFSMGLPTIATDVKGVNNLVQHRKNGLLFPLYDAKGVGKKDRRTSGRLYTQEKDRPKCSSFSRATVF